MNDEQLRANSSADPSSDSGTAGSRGDRGEDVPDKTEDVRRLLEIERRQRLIAEELHGIARHITSEPSLDEALAAVLRAAEKLFGATSASIYLTDQSEIFPNRRFTTRHTGEPHWDERGVVRPGGATARVLRTGQSIVVGNAPAGGGSSRPASTRPGTRAVIPIRHGQRTIGALLVNWDEYRYCSQVDLRLLETLAAYGAIAVENVRLRERDATARQEIEEARLRLQQFIGMVAHDLRGPLGVVATSLELLRDNRRRSRAGIEQHVLPATENAIRRMRRLVDDLLGAARIGAGRFHVRPFPMDLVEVARRVVEQHQATSELHRLILEAPDELPGEWDPERIGQLLTNLISNAIRYSPDGGDVRVSVIPRADEVIIQVTDQGIGIRPDEEHLIFEPFLRLQHDAESEGLGLGLYIAKAIAEAHGGRIWVASEPERGTSFFVALPATGGGAEQLSPTANSTPTSTAGA